MPIYLGNQEIGKDYYGSLPQGRIYQGTQVIQGGYSVDYGAYAYYDASISASYPGSGSTWFDLTSNGNNLTFTGSVTYDTNSLAFSASYAYKATGSNFGTGSEFTMCAWVNYTQIIGAGSGNQNQFFGLNDDTRFGAQSNYGTPRSLYNINGVGTLALNGIAVPTNTWIFYSFVMSGSTPSYPINTIISGSQIPQTYQNGFITNRTSDTWGGGAFNEGTNPALFVGGYSESSFNFFGKIGIVAVYNKTLSSSSILDFYEATKGKYGY
jgi:hypothetical protein